MWLIVQNVIAFLPYACGIPEENARYKSTFGYGVADLYGMVSTYSGLSEGRAYPISQNGSKVIGPIRQTRN